MRSKLTNILQVIVLVTGILYISIGSFFFYSPMKFVKLFSINVTDDWIKGIQYDTFIAPLFFIARAFASGLFSSGLSMVLPLYDPLKYRGLIYYTGIVFPFISSLFLVYNGIKFDHWIVTIVGLIFLFIGALTAIGLIITRKEAGAGIE